MGSGASSLAGKSEKQLKDIFQGADKDGSGKIDSTELLTLLDELEIGDDANRQQLLVDWLVESSVDDGDEQLDFKEFKLFVKYCGDKAKGKKAKAPVRGRDSKALDPATEQLRKQKAEQRAKEKAEAAAKLAAENRERRKRLAEAKGKDSKCLSAETEAARKAKEEDSKAAHDQQKKDDLARSRELKESIATQGSRTDIKLSDDIENARQDKAELSRVAQEQSRQVDKEHAKEIEKIKSTEARVDDGDGHVTTQKLEN